jgi:hypothetical protein
VYLFLDTEHETRARAVLDAVASGAYALDEDVDVVEDEVPAERD